jgi:hypothetical protein
MPFILNPSQPKAPQRRASSAARAVDVAPSILAPSGEWGKARLFGFIADSDSVVRPLFIDPL